MGTRRTHFTASILNDEIHVFGGRNEKGLIATSEVYSIADNKWRYGQKMEYPRCCHAQVTCGDNIVISGGYVQGMF